MTVEFRTVFSLMLAGLLLAAAPVMPAPHPVRIADTQLCADDMEVEPGFDGYDTVAVADVVDGGCQVPQDVVSV